MSKGIGTRLFAVALVGVVAALLTAAAASAGPPGQWPKKGELCFLVDASGGEWSVLRLQVTGTGGTHYDLQGYAQQWDGYPYSVLQPIDGSAQQHVSGDIVALITKVEYRPGATAPEDEFETYSGMLVMNGELEDAGAVGTVTSCTNTVPSVCEVIYSTVALYHDADCDPLTDQPPGFPPV